MRTLSFLLGVLFVCFPFPKLYGQSCSDANLWIQKAQDIDAVVADCDLYISSFERILNNCLLDKDSFDVSIGQLYYTLGGIHYFCVDDQNAIANFQKSLKARLNTNNINHGDVGRSYWMLGNSYSYLEKNDLAIEFLTKATTHLEQADTAIKLEYLPSSYGSLGEMYESTGDYYKALFYLDKAEQSISQAEVLERIRFKKIKGHLYGDLRKYDEALQEYQTCVKLLEKKGINNDLDIFAYAGYLSDIGYVQTLKGNYSSAQKSFDKAISYYETKASADTLNSIITYINLAHLQYEMGQFSKLETTTTKALNLANKRFLNRYHPRISELFYRRAKAYFKQKKYEDALENIQSSVQSLVPSFRPQSLSENPIITKQTIGDAIRLRQTLALKAQVYQQKYEEELSQADLMSAYRSYQTLDTLITQTRQSFQSVNSKYFLQESIIPIYEQAINTSLDLYNLTKNQNYRNAAYRFMARNKAIILLEGLQDQQVKFATIPADLLQKELDLKKRFKELELTIYQAQQEDKTKELKQLQDSLFITRRAYDKLIQSFERDYPKYFQHKHDYYAEANIQNIQNQLATDQAVIEFFVGEKTFFVSVISNNEFEIYTTRLPDEFRDVSNKFIKMTRGEGVEEEAFSQLSYQLYQFLFEPILKKLNNSIKRLVIIPDDILLHMPFEALLTSNYAIGKNDWNAPDIPYLLRKYAISQVYANSLLFNKKAQKEISKAEKIFGGFGIEYYDFTKKRDSIQLDSITEKRISGRLLHSDDEVLGIQEIYGGDVFVNRAATKQRFMEMGEKYDLLHFATHGFADEKLPLNSALVFAKLPNARDHMLRANEVYGMKFNSSLAYLSACQTNYGPLQKGEGMRSISRAFAYAGCPSLVASLWSITDKSSKEIAIQFYQNLKLGQTKDVALQKAKLNYLGNIVDVNKALPHLWAQTIIIGDAQAITRSGSSNAIMWIVGIGLVLLLLGIRKST